MRQNTPKKSPLARKPTGKIHYETTGRNLTSQGGLIPVIKFLDGLGFYGLSNQCVHHACGHNAQYELVDAVFLVLMGLMGGARSLSQCLVVWSDALVRRVAGWRSVPDESTSGRVFKEVRERHVSELKTLVQVLQETALTGVSRTAATISSIGTTTKIAVVSAEATARKI